MKYADAGVDIEKEGEFIGALVSALKHVKKGYEPLDIGRHFTSLIPFGEYAIAVNTDGVGSKVLVAEAMGEWDTVGIDVVAMNVNDTICVGAEPVAFVDYLAIERYDERAAREIGVGLNRGCELADVTLIGGETATLPEIVRGFDLSGTSVGIVRRDRVITGRDVSEGDVVIGLRSSGIHSNGLTLARKVFRDAGYAYEDFHAALGRKVGEELLIPTEIYVKAVMEVIERVNVHGLAHITGGGLRNLLRIGSVRYVIDEPFEPQPIFRVIAEMGGVPDEEMYQTFNMGMGFAVVVSADDEKEALSVLRKYHDAKRVGYVERGKGVFIEPLEIEYSRY
jgi:phosphoribosylformylglycinamidine cyclo-ligase